MKQHELLAVEQELKVAAQRATAKARTTFSNAEGLLGEIKVYEPLEDDGQQFPPIRRELVTTVSAELTEMWDAASKFLNATIAKETTNQGTNADIVIDEEVILSDLPATALLNLEGRLGELRVVLDAIPTNDPSKRWTWDADNGYWVAAPQVAYKTEKVMDSYVAYEATEHHPAQVQVFNKDVRVGQWTTHLQSGMISPVAKKNLMARIDALIMAVKAARQRANDTDVWERDIAGPIFEYLFSGAGLL